MSKDTFISCGEKTDRLIVTLVGGDFHTLLASKTHPSIIKYAKKCLADFLVINSDESCDYLTWGKFKLGSFLKTYKRVMYIDSDILVTEKAGDLFKIVPVSKIGMFNEYPFSSDWVDWTYVEYLKFIGLPVDQYFDKKHYYNSGLILFSRGHEKLFTYPVEVNSLERERELCGDQCYFNINLVRHSLKVYDIGPEYNAFVSRENEGKLFGVAYDDVKIFHFAGLFKKAGIASGEAYKDLDSVMAKLKPFISKRHLMRSNNNLVSGLDKLISMLPEDCIMAELGSFAGESTAMFAKKCKIVYSIDLWGEECTWGITSRETSEDIEKRFDLVVLENKNIVKLKGRTDEEYKKFADESLDVLYEDCCHSYEAVKENFKNWLPKVKRNGVVCGHDYNPKQFPGVIKAVKETFGDRVVIFEDTSWLAKASDEKISVLIPMFNREEYIKEALQSILEQTHSNLDILIYDDGSSDSSVKIVTELQKKDDRIKLIIGDGNKGISFARNFLLDSCNTRLACWMDSDDVSNRYRIEFQFPRARLGKSLVFTQAEYYRNGDIVNVEGVPRKRNLEKFYCEKDVKCKNFHCSNSTPCVMFPVDKEIRFLPHGIEHLTGEDCEWAMSMSNKYSLEILDDVLYFHRSHDGRITKNAAKLGLYFDLNKLNKSTSYLEAVKMLNDKEKVLGASFLIPAYRESDLFVPYKVHSNKVVVTIVSGNFHKYLSTLTHKSLKDYAWRCQADFKVLLHPDEDHSACCWKKFEIAKLFDRYDRVMYIDTDVYVVDSAVDLFKAVPEDCIGAFNEVEQSRGWIEKAYIRYLNALKLNHDEYYDPKTYINAGIFLVSKRHISMFNLPTDPEAFKHDWDFCGEQCYLNINIKKNQYQVYDIGVPYNAFVQFLGENKIHNVSLMDCKMFHFAGMFKQEDLDKWETYSRAKDEVEKLLKKVSCVNSNISISIRTSKVDENTVSILMPVFNREKTLKDSIDSILNQSYKNIQLIIYNDGSTDGSHSICKEYFDRDKRVVYLHGIKNFGIPTARNILLDSCKSEFACWMDSDDISNFRRVEVQRRFIRKGLMIKANCMVFNGQSSVNYYEEPAFSPIRVNCLPSIMFPVDKRILCDSKFILGGEDDDWVKRMEETGCKTLWIGDILYYYRVHENRITNLKGQILSVLREGEEVGKSYSDLLELYKTRI
jgi:glycosyltransferase involved in cell wall biosynthesis